MLETITSFAEFESKVPDIDWDVITQKELHELPTLQLGRISNVLDMTEKDKEILVLWKEVFKNKLPPLKKFVWGDILEKRQNKEFAGFNGLNNESHAYNKFLPHGFTCENFDHERMHSGMGIETFKDGKNVTRGFCEKMVAAKKIYRKEDIEQMGNQAVNPGWGPRGADTYSIWLYKGGGACHHYWMRKTYMYKGKGSIDIKSPLTPSISVNKAIKEGFKPEKNNPLVAKRPIDMPNEGFLPTNKRR